LAVKKNKQMTYAITGKLIAKLGTLTVNDKFKKQEFVIEVSEEVNGNVYPNPIKMQLVNNRCSLVDLVPIGANIKCSFNIKGNSWQKDGKANYMVNLDCWKIENA
jgi:hypothetical protein